LLDETLYTAAEALRIICAWLYPVMPASAAKIWEQLGMPGPISEVRTADLHWGKLQAGQKVGKVAGVFPRLDAKTAIPQMQELELKERERQAAIFAPPQPTAAAPMPVAEASKIAIDDFVRVEMRVGLVLAAERVKGADKLLHLKVEIGEAAPRSIVAGIAEAYPPEQLIGRKVVIVANLQPRKLRGLESDGMIVAASIEGGKPVLAGFLEDVPVGARLK
jgi:methionyl-tRNA synthetase